MAIKEVQDHKLSLRDVMFIGAILFGSVVMGVRLGRVEATVERVAQVIDRIAPPTIQQQTSRMAAVPTPTEVTR